MYHLRKLRISLISLSVCSAVCLCAGCTRSASETTSEGSGYYFDTTVSIKITDEHAETLLQGCMDICEELENTLSARKESSELYQVNHRDQNRVDISDDLAECIATALKWSEASDGVYDLTIYPVSSLWDFHAENPEVPDSEKISGALEAVDYRNVSLDGNTITFSSDETQIDLGGIAKGYISEKLKTYLTENGCTSALINLGGNVSTVGHKDDGSEWIVGVQKPFSVRGEVLLTVGSADNCVISSGIYERYFEQDGEFYHHIIDPSTGYPAKTDLNQVTVIGSRDADCDALSTICLLLGEEKAVEFYETQNLDVTLIFTNSENEVTWYPEEPAS